MGTVYYLSFLVPPLFLNGEIIMNKLKIYFIRDGLN
jgi:hypothetical protein